MFKKSKSEKYNNKKSRQRKLKAFDISAFVMMLRLSLRAWLFLLRVVFSFLRSGNSSSFLFCSVFALAFFIFAVFFLVIFTNLINKQLP